MSNTHKDKPPRQRSRKSDERGQKPDQQQSPKLVQQDEDRISAMVASTDPLTNGAATPAEPPSSGAPAPADSPSVAPADKGPISIQTIANAYRDYTKKSFQETGSFVEKLMAVRSFDQAIEVQTEFARQAYANFVAESQKICELHTELARQIIFRPWQGFAAR
jgi:hypothetical protein